MGGVEEQGVVRGGRYRFALFIFCFATLSCLVGATVNPTDLTALNALSSAWGANTLGWTSGDPCVNEWDGVGCDATNNTVVSLDLCGFNLVGTIPAAITSFSGLTILDLSFNPNLTGSIPPEIGNLASLTQLAMQSCALTGPIPTELGNLKNLTFIALNNNQLTGEIPYSVGGLQNVYWFDLANNNLTGPLPVSSNNADGIGLDTMAACEHFHLSNNSFAGGIPSELGAPPNGGPIIMTKIRHLLFESNNLNGSIPDSLGNLTSLRILSLSNNQLSGPIPITLTTLATAPGSNLTQLLLGNNQFTGTIPDFTPPVGGALGLLVVDFSYNHFDPQPFPAWPQFASNITTLYMEEANFVGSFSNLTEILSLPWIQTLWAGNNSLNGTLFIPASIGQWLCVVSLQSNQINNTELGSSSTNLSQVSFELSDNPVCNPDNPFIPSKVCNTTASIPDYMATYGTCGIPTCSDGLTFNTANTGNCSCADPFKILLVSRRPAFSSFLNGTIAGLESALSTELGLQPKQVMVERAAFSDGRANFSINFFSADGVSPLDQATTANITFSLNHQVPPLLDIAPYVLAWFEARSLEIGHKYSLAPGIIAGIVLGFVALLSAVGVYAYLQKRRAYRMELRTQPFAKWGVGEGEKDVAAPQMHGARWFSFAEVKKATNQFSEENEIGEGGYGKVYAGVLPSGERVAVKRAQEGSLQGAEEFKTEIELLSRVHHKNLVGLVGYCYDLGEQMLVYEFMVNGTIHEWLSGKKAYPLDWSKRLSIAIGSARGLAYLHEMANPPIIHRDIKSSNILLDDKHIAKVADFGLSKLAPDGADKQIETTQVKGTLGYLDPEYYMEQKFSEKSDVYSFGVVLLELLTSKAPISQGRYIVREMKIAYGEEGMEGLEPILDPSVHEAPPQDLQRFLDLALECCEEKGDNRPTMNEVVKVLEALAQHNKAKAKVSALATDETWLQDTYGDDIGSHADYSEGKSSSFLYSGGYMPQGPEPK